MIALELVAMAGGLGRLDRNLEGASLRLIEARQEYADLDLQIFAQRIKRLRVQAELNDTEFVVEDPHASDPKVQALQERVVAGERRLFDIRLSTLRANEEAFKAQEASYTQEMESLKQSITLHDQEIVLIEQDVEATRKLADKALTSQSNFRQTERELSATRRDALEMQTFLARAEQNRLALQQQRASLRQARKDEAATTLQATDLDLARMTKRQESLMATMAQIAAGSQAQPEPGNADAVLSIMRPSDGAYRELPADETIALKPGDILRVRFELEKPGRQASAG
jgi:polysaccharide export outer membrane protein